MTGIERLRELGREQDERSWSTVGKVRGRMMLDIADQIEREQEAMVADSPYDAILPEDREAIAWVRKNGGIAYVKEEWRRRSNLDRQLERAQAKVERQQRHIEFVQGKLTERNERNERIAELERQRTEAVSAQLASDAALYDLRREVLDVCRAHRIEAGDDPLRAIDEAMNRRLMPEGME